jgi:hypothetical protein
MKIFVDYHHEGLYQSLRELLEYRLGHEVYRPIGKEWFAEGYWKIAEPYNNHPNTIEQFLGLNGKAWDKYKNKNGEWRVEDDIYHISNPIYNGVDHKAIKFSMFPKMNFDIVIASYNRHIKPYNMLIERYSPNTKLVHQMGNNWANSLDYSITKNIMASASGFTVPPDVNLITYHQEFSLENFSYAQPTPNNKITSFVNLLPRPDLYNQFKTMMPDYEFKAHGMQCPDGTIMESTELAKIMQNSMFGYHYKPEGDGYGHVLHNWYAVGRPIIVNYSGYAKFMGGALLTPDVTCIDIDINNIPATVEKIRHFSEPSRHAQMSAAAYSRFKQVVDFDKEAEEIDKFLHNLK